MKIFFQNIWTKRAVSIFSLVYGIMLGMLSYMSVFYNVQIENSTAFTILISVISVLFLVMMIYTRKQFLTRFVSILAVPLFLPVLLFYFGEWLLLVPLAAVIVIMFFVSGAGEATKTILGTLSLLLYVVGAVAYFLFSTFIGTQTQDVVIQVAESESKLYRSYVVDTIDSSTGGTKIYVEPNNLDKNFKYIRFIAKGYKKLVYNDRNHYNISMEWATVSQDELSDMDMHMDISIDRIEFLKQNGILSWNDQQLETIRKLLGSASNTINYNENYGLVFDMELSDATADMLGLKRETVQNVTQEEQVTVTNTCYYELGLSTMQRQIFGMPDEGDCTLDTEQMDHLVSVAVVLLNKDQLQGIIDRMNSGGTVTYYDECDKYPEGAIQFDFDGITADEAESLGLKVHSEKTTKMVDVVTEEELTYYPVTIDSDVLQSIGMADSGDVLYITAYDDDGNIVDNSNGEKLDRMVYFRYDEAVMNRWFSKDKREFDLQ